VYAERVRRTGRIRSHVLVVEHDGIGPPKETLDSPGPVEHHQFMNR
jgi:hypothetical protein